MCTPRRFIETSKRGGRGEGRGLKVNVFKRKYEPNLKFPYRDGGLVLKPKDPP